LRLGGTKRCESQRRDRRGCHDEFLHIEPPFPSKRKTADEVRLKISQPLKKALLCNFSCKGDRLNLSLLDFIDAKLQQDFRPPRAHESTGLWSNGSRKTAFTTTGQ
jgi:hypothetical protein